MSQSHRIRRPAASPAWFLCSLVFLTAPLAAQFPKVAYEIQEGSSLIDDCDCERPRLMAWVSGSFILQRLPVRIVGELYEVSELQIAACVPCRAGGARYSFTGGGSY